MISTQMAAQTLQSAGPKGILGAIPPSESAVHSFMAAESSLGFSDSASMGGAPGVFGGPGAGGYAGQGGPQFPLALSPEEKAQAADRLAAIQGRDDDISGLPCEKKAKADQYRKEHNMLMQKLAEQQGGQVVAG